MLTQYSATREKLPPNVRQALDNYYAEAVKQNLDSRDKAARAAEIAIEVTVMAQPLLQFHSVAEPVLLHFPLLMPQRWSGSASLVGGTTRMALISGIRGEGRMTGSEKFEQFKSGMVDGMLLASPLLFGRNAVTAERVAGSELAPVISRPVANC